VETETAFFKNAKSRSQKNNILFCHITEAIILPSMKIGKDNHTLHNCFKTVFSYFLISFRKFALKKISGKQCHYNQRWWHQLWTCSCRVSEKGQA